MPWRLDSVEDLRPYDWESATRLSEAIETGESCAHCGSDAGPVFYRVSNQTTQQQVSLCPQHVAPFTGGWEPSGEALDRAQRQLAKAVQAERTHAIHFDAADLARRFMGASQHSPLSGLAASVDQFDRFAGGAESEYRTEVRARATYLVRRSRARALKQGDDDESQRRT